ncbi:MAG: S8 family serine peptidase [Lautropia sp.]|nr:S8 family serine peptidase [Lautropia sp.]
MRSVLPLHSTRWPLPLLIAMLAACGGSGAGNEPSAPNGFLVLSPDGTPVWQMSGSTGSNDSETNGTNSIAVGNSTVDGPNGAESDPSRAAATSHNYTSSSHCPVKYQPGPLLAQGNGADPLLARQWHLNNTGSLAGTLQGEDINVRNVWGSFKGEGIRIAVLDDAVDVLHKDLRPNVLPGASRNYRADHRNDPVRSTYPMPCYLSDTHGTSVAGVIAARDDNGYDVSGVAPRASLIGFNVLATNLDSDIQDALTREQERNHVYNNSWGAPDTGHFYSAPSALPVTLEDGLKKGRAGLGSIYVFAAGNGGCLGTGSDTSCQGSDLATYDGHVGLLGALAICATNAAGKRAFYSEPGANLLVCAPSAAHDNQLPGITTTTIQDKTTHDFGGTSAAAPMASGVVALMLQANPNLTWRDVRLVLAHSARKVDPDNTGWTRFGDLNFNHEYGFGVIDAEAAVKLARNWQTVGGSDRLKTCTIPMKTVAQDVPETAQPNGNGTDYNARATGGLVSTVTVPGTAECNISHIEHIKLNISTSGTGPDSSHADAGNLHITLTSPSGQTSTLATPHPCYTNTILGLVKSSNCGGLRNFDFGITRHMDEPAVKGNNRTWTLEVADRSVNRETGTLADWTLTLYGR